MPPGLEGAGKFDWSPQRGRYQFAHMPDAQREYGVRDSAEIWPAIKHRRLEPVGGRNQRRQFPIRKMGSKHECRLAIVAQCQKAFDAAGVVVDERAVPWIALGQTNDVRKLDRDTPEIVPDAAQ